MTDTTNHVTELADAARRIYRTLEMSAGIMRDPCRTGGWEGAERTASAFERQAIAAKALHDRLAALASAPAGDGVERWEGANPVEQGVYDHFMTGSQRGDLYNNVKRGRMNVQKPDRSSGTQFAAWMAGRHLAEREALARPRAAVGEQSA